MSTQPEEQLIQLGRLASAAASVESLNRVLLFELMDEDPQVGRDLFGHMFFAEMNRRIVPLANHRPIGPGTLLKVREATEDAAEAMRLRNDVLHSHWTAEGVQLPGKGTKPPRPQLVTLDNVTAVATMAENAHDHLQLAWGLVCMDLGRINDGRLPDRWATGTAPEASQLPDHAQRMRRSFSVSVSPVSVEIAGLAATATGVATATLTATGEASTTTGASGVASATIDATGEGSVEKGSSEP